MCIICHVDYTYYPFVFGYGLYRSSLEHATENCSILRGEPVNKYCLTCGNRSYHIMIVSNNPHMECIICGSDSSASFAI